MGCGRGNKNSFICLFVYFNASKSDVLGVYISGSQSYTILGFISTLSHELMGCLFVNAFSLFEFHVI
jgi:hypothetical protein